MYTSCPILLQTLTSHYALEETIWSLFTRKCPSVGFMFTAVTKNSKAESDCLSLSCLCLCPILAPCWYKPDALPRQPVVFYDETRWDLVTDLKRGVKKDGFLSPLTSHGKNYYIRFSFHGKNSGESELWTWQRVLFLLPMMRTVCPSCCIAMMLLSACLADGFSCLLVDCCVCLPTICPLAMFWVFISVLISKTMMKYIHQQTFFMGENLIKTNQNCSFFGRSWEDIRSEWIFWGFVDLCGSSGAGLPDV